MTTTRRPKTITTPEFTCGGAIPATVAPQTVTLDGSDGYYKVAVMRNDVPMVIGRIYKDGTGWTAHFAGDKEGTMPTHTGDHYPTRTGKHTQTFALCHLIARVVGFSSSHASYSLRYDGVRA